MEQTNETNNVAAADVAGKLAEATQAMAEALHNINAQFEGLHAKVDRIVAAVEVPAESEASSLREQGLSQVSTQGTGANVGHPAEAASLREKLASAEKANQDLKAQAEQARRKTLSPLVTTLLAKEGVEGDALIEAPVLEKALGGLSVEQRIAVKAELARAGILT